MTPQEYIDRERRRAQLNLGWAIRRNDDAAMHRLAERLQVLCDIERGLKTLHRKKEACQLMRAAVEVLAAEDSGDADAAIAAVVDGEEYTIQDLVFGMCEIVNAWEGDVYGD